jgi:histidine ammonia-lyase
MKSTSFLMGTNPLTWEEIQEIETHSPELQLTPECWSKIQAAHDYIKIKSAQSDAPLYGINTGFGAFHSVKISTEDLSQLQINLILSHACGAGPEVPVKIVRWMLFLKIRSLAYGNSGVKPETVQRLLDMYNSGIIPVVYTQGSLGASGDLAPLAHLCLPLIGKGEVFIINENRKCSSAEWLQTVGLSPIIPGAKEGLALLNGTQFMLAYALQLALQSKQLIQQADILGALSLDVFWGKAEPFHPLIHQVRPHTGQKFTANNILKYLAESELQNLPKKQTQDPYSFRCIPQVHGASQDTFNYYSSIILTEINSVTDNPNVFPEEDLILSGGNFHGQPLALVLDFLAIALAEIGSISERRIYLLLSGQRELPLFLTPSPGLNSGLMIAQYLAAALVSKNKQACMPMSVDSIPSSNGQEDHVSMGANGAVRTYEVAENVNTILAIELMHGLQALYFRRPLKTGKIIENWISSALGIFPFIQEDRIISEDIKRLSEWLRLSPVRN